MTGKLKKRERFLVGVTLFSMFFGAGNLIFPPFLGANAGTKVWVAFVGFAASAIGLPIFGVSAIAKVRGLDKLAGKVHPVFATVFTMLIYLCIGPFLAIPRTAVTSFEMAVTPFVGSVTSQMLIAYAVVFFAIALCLAWRPDNLTQKLGKVTTPCLLVLIFVVVMACLIHPIGDYAAPTATYATMTLATGFLDGYQTMDMLAALIFGIVIAMNIRRMGVEDEAGLVKETIYAGLIAGVVLLLVYGGLAHVGALSGGSFPNQENGAGVLTAVVGALFGRFGTVILALIFFFACMNTCVGLLCCCGEYFSTVFPKISYHVWAVLFAIGSMMISIVGLNQILSISVPILNAIYPIAIVLIVLAFFPSWCQHPQIYRICILVTGIVSVVGALDGEGLSLSFLHALLIRLPFYEAGFAWLVPAIISFVAAALWKKKTN